MPSESLIARIRGEYREMPGLHLTFRQACRLWQLDAAECEGMLESLVAEGFLVRTAGGAFMAMPAIGPEPYADRAPAFTGYNGKNRRASP
jgi:hypothetical protein